MSKIRCNTCETATVEQIGENPLGVKYFICSKCREAKRWCPRCDQGWVQKWIDPRTQEVLFNCEECEATWQSIDKIGTSDTSQFGRPFDGSMNSFTQVKTYET